jgi:glycosyltransferase involved in cell wall biosynthesis
MSADRIEEQLVIGDANILVGIPCYKDGLMVGHCLRSLIEPKVQLLIVDNGAPIDVKQAIEGRGIVIRNDVNRYVNPAWNQMMRYFLNRPGKYDMLVLANSDLVLDPGWSSTLRTHLANDPREQLIFGLDAPRHRTSAGSFFAMTARAVAVSYPIPDDLLIMGGDDFIFHVCRQVGCAEPTLQSLTMTHVERGTYDKSPEVWEIARQDTERWHRTVLPNLVPQRVAEFLAAHPELGSPEI